MHKARAYDNCPFSIEIYVRKKLKKDPFEEYKETRIVLGTCRMFDKLHATLEVVNISVLINK